MSRQGDHLGPSSHEKGIRAESIAAFHLRLRGYRILERNWRCPLGEVDIIARQGRTLVFVEVKSRRNPGFADPVRSVNRRKAARVLRAAQWYLAARTREPTPVRFDVVGVSLDGCWPRVRIVRSAFGTEVLEKERWGRRWR